MEPAAWALLLFVRGVALLVSVGGGLQWRPHDSRHTLRTANAVRFLKLHLNLVDLL